MLSTVDKLTHLGPSLQNAYERSKLRHDELLCESRSKHFQERKTTIERKAPIFGRVFSNNFEEMARNMSSELLVCNAWKDETEQVCSIFFEGKDFVLIERNVI